MFTNTVLYKGLDMRKIKGNPVAKNINKFNKPATHIDRKKAMKKGHCKHKLETVGL